MLVGGIAEYDGKDSIKQHIDIKSIPCKISRIIDCTSKFRFHLAEAVNDGQKTEKLSGSY